MYHILQVLRIIAAFIFSLNQHGIFIHSTFQTSNRKILAKDDCCAGFLPQGIEKDFLNMRKPIG